MELRFWGVRGSIWGHSSWVAAEACVDLLFLSHHDPTRTDAQLGNILNEGRDVFPKTELATEQTICIFPSCIEGVT